MSQHSVMAAHLVMVIDTNIMWTGGKPFAAGGSWTELLTRAKEQTPGIEFVVPQVVVEELANHERQFRTKRKSEGATGWGQAIAALEDAGVELPEGLPSVTELRARKDVPTLEKIAERITTELREHTVTVLPVPDGCGHGQLVRRSLLSHPPFDATGYGYRDALIWENVCELASKDPSGPIVVLVSKDKDFRHGKSEVLHPYLAADLHERGKKGQVRIVGNLGAALQICRDTAAGPVRQSPAEGICGVVSAAIAQYCDRKFYGQTLTFDDLDGGSESLFDVQLADEIETPTIREVQPHLQSSLVLEPDETLDGGTELGTARVSATITYEGFVHKADYAGSQHDWDVIDGNWNRHYMWVSGTFETEMAFHYHAEPGYLLALDFVDSHGLGRN